MKKEPNKNKLVIIIICVVLVLLTTVGAIIYTINYHLKQEKILNEELVLITEKNLISDNYDVDIKTNGDYAYVEEAIKIYYKDLSTNIKTIYTYLNDEKLIQILSANNLKNDGPNFETSYQILNDTRNNTNTAMNNIIELCSEEKIKNFIEKDKINNYYYDLYLDLMYTEDDLEKLNSTKKEIQEIKDNLSIFLDKVEAMLNMLKNNSDYWYIEDGQLYFETTSLVNEYNKLYNDLNTFVTNNFSKYTY